MSFLERAHFSLSDIGYDLLESQYRRNFCPVILVHIIYRLRILKNGTLTVTLICRNLSLGMCMCPQNQWEKVGKGSWFRSMSPFDHKLLDIRVAGSSLETFEMSIEEGVYQELLNELFACIYFPFNL